ncbi:MAG: hypothetical protein ACTSVU_09545 [Promethearchaeota archaeon]
MNDRLQPKLVWKILEEIYNTPPKGPFQGQEIPQRIKSWLLKRAKDKKISLKIKEDALGNLLIKKQATPGMEQCPPILLHAHYDYYQQERKFSLHNRHSHVNIHPEEGYVELVGTPLFDDSVVGVGIICSILGDTSANISHGPIEAFMTVKKDEKFIGALNFDPDFFQIQSKYLLNFDAVDLGTITNSTAGCAEFIYSKTFPKMQSIENVPLKFISLTVNGLLGGEMGSEIHFYRANAIKLIARCLTGISEQIPIYICEWSGGDLYRFIPQESYIKIAIPLSDMERFEELFQQERKGILRKYHTFTEYGENLEPKLNLFWTESTPDSFYSKDSTTEILTIANLIPHGLNRSCSLENEVGKISNNFAKVETIAKTVRFFLKSRGDNKSEFRAFNLSLLQLGRFGKWKIENSYNFPVWEPSTSRTFLKFVQHRYENILQQPVRIAKIYWTLEPGIIARKIPGLEAISIGPTEIGVYPSNYKVQIRDIQILYRLTKSVLKDLPQLAEIH